MRIHEVLFATDFSPASARAAQVARETALSAGARLHVVYVVPPVTDPGDADPRVRALARDLGAGLEVRTAVLSGRVASHLVAYARDNGIDLIVLGTHGRTGVSRAILGSVAEAVIRSAGCLVLTVPAAVPEPRAETPPPPLPGHHCIVCGGATEDLVCEACRARIRGEELEQPAESSRAGR